MSRVARSARVASRQRPEIITTDKTIQAAETGELYLINHNAGSTITLTLPPVQDGAYFRFQFMTAMNAVDAKVNIVTANGAGTIKGTVLNFIYQASSVDADVATNKDNTSLLLCYSGSLTGQPANTIHVGTYLDLHCDGTNWQASGKTIASHLSASVFHIGA